MANNQNLTPFKKGSKEAREAGAKGKRGPSIRTSLLRILEQNLTKKQLNELYDQTVEQIKSNGRKFNTGVKSKRIIDQINSVLVARALTGDMAAIKEVNDRTDGKSPQSIELTGDEDKPIKQEIDITPSKLAAIAKGIVETTSGNKKSSKNK